MLPNSRKCMSNQCSSVSARFQRLCASGTTHNSVRPRCSPCAEGNVGLSLIQCTGAHPLPLWLQVEEVEEQVQEVEAELAEAVEEKKEAEDDVKKAAEQVKAAEKALREVVSTVKQAA